MTDRQLTVLSKLTYIEPSEWKTMIEYVRNLKREVDRLTKTIEEMKHEEYHKGIDRDLNS